MNNLTAILILVDSTVPPSILTLTIRDTNQNPDQFSSLHSALLKDSNRFDTFDNLRKRFEIDGLRLIYKNNMPEVVRGIFEYPRDWSVAGARIYARNVLNDQDRWYLETHILHREEKEKVEA